MLKNMLKSIFPNVDDDDEKSTFGKNSTVENSSASSSSLLCLSACVAIFPAVITALNAGKLAKNLTT